MTESDVDTVLTLMMTDKSTRDTSDPSTYTQKQMECSEPSITSRSAAGVQGTQITVECPGDDQKIRIVAVETETNIVAVMFSAPISEFDANVGVFDSAVASLNVQGAVDSEGTGGTSGGGGDGGGLVSIELTTVTRAVVIAGADVDVNIRTNSTIGQLELDEENKRVSFTVDGEDGTTGTTEIEIGKMLEGPYTVAIDGQATTDFEVANEGSAEAVLTVSYTHSEHDVDITGTNVVPEFPAVAIGAIAAIIGIVALMGRTRFLGLPRK
jgi:hypothetical protein